MKTQLRSFYNSLRIATVLLTGFAILMQFEASAFRRAAPEIQMKLVEETTSGVVETDINMGGLVNFGDVVYKQELIKTFKIENKGTASLELTLPINAVTGDEPSPDFIVDAVGVPVSIPVSHSVTFTVKFSPSVVGIRTGSVQITSNDADESTYTINLKGTGVKAPLTVKANNLERPTGDNTPVSVGNALHFDGVDDKADLGNPSEITNVGSGFFTVEAWIKVPANNKRMQIVSFGSSTGGNGSGLWFYINADNKLKADLSYIPGPVSDKVVADGLWHHVAVVNNFSDFQLYVDGVASGNSVFMAPAISSENGNFSIGGPIPGVSGTETFFMEGSIGEVRVWNWPRSAEDIGRDMYELTFNSANLVSHYVFNQGNPGGDNVGITTIADLGTLKNPGTLVGFGLSGSTSNWVESGMVETILTYTNANGVAIDPTEIMVKPVVTTTATKASGAGEYPLVPTGGYDENYEFTAYEQGTLTISTTTAVKDKLADIQLKLYPNPTTGQITIIGLEPKQELQISVLDIMGKLVYAQKAKANSIGNVQVDLKSQSSGHYFISIETAKTKIVKQVLVQQ